MKLKQGFTLIELLVVMIIIAIMATVVIPNLGPRPADKRKEFISQLNALTSLGWYNAIITNKMHKIDIDVNKRIITLEIQTKKGEMNFVPVRRKYVASTLRLPTEYEIREFIVQGKNLVSGVFQKAEFYILAGGLASDIIINFVDKKDKLPSGQMRPFSLVLNPFSAQFREYGSFQR